MSELQVAIYARVSSDQQSDAGTIASQLAQLRERVKGDGFDVSSESEFIDEGFSGATLLRPSLERLRDLVAAGAVDRIYVHSPDRLARNYAYQVLLVDEFRRSGVDLVFLNRGLGQSPEDDLLLQVQGMVAEYERAKILERSRRGKKYAARRGVVNVLSGAPYGYRYVPKHEGGGGARYEIEPDEAGVVREIFAWVGRDRLTIGEVTRRLTARKERTRTGKVWWDRTTVWGILRNPAYMGEAAFGKTRIGPKRPALRSQRGKPHQTRKTGSTYDVPPKEWTGVPVPALVSHDLFGAVQEQLQENRTQARLRKRGATYLLQGLIACSSCGYAYYGKPVSLKSSKGVRRDYAYYRCCGSDAYRFGGERICSNKQVRTDLLDNAVWSEVVHLLNNPERIQKEHARRQGAPADAAVLAEANSLAENVQKVRRGIGRLIDGYTEGWIEKGDFNERMKRLKSRLDGLEEQKATAERETSLEAELRLIIGRLEEFAEKVANGLGTLDWTGRRELIRTLVKRIEVQEKQVKVVFKVVGQSPFASAPDDGDLQRCWGRDGTSLRSTLLARGHHSPLHHSGL